MFIHTRDAVDQSGQSAIADHIRRIVVSNPFVCHLVTAAVCHIPVRVGAIASTEDTEVEVDAGRVTSRPHSTDCLPFCYGTVHTGTSTVILQMRIQCVYCPTVDGVHQDDMITITIGETLVLHSTACSSGNCPIGRYNVHAAVVRPSFACHCIGIVIEALCDRSTGYRPLPAV